jgi:predicted kinase
LIPHDGNPRCHRPHIAPVHICVLQVRYMRKWMSERLKRRKKPGEGSPKEANTAPEPLQPRFYDDEPAAPSAVPHEIAVEAPVAESRRAPQSEAEPAAETPSTPSGAAAARPRTPRRRRSRGGRGGSRPRTAGAPPAPVIAAALSATEPSVLEPSAALKSAQSASIPVAPLARASKGTVVLAIGLPGSGKSSWFKRHNIHPLSSDLLRELLFDDAQEQRFQDLVFSNLRSMLKARLIARRPLNYVDATNLTPQDRHSWIKLAKDYGYDVQGVFFDVPLEVCMERHQRRGRSVPEDIMRKMAGKLKAPTFDEGFSKITVVRVKQKSEAEEAV